MAIGGYARLGLVDVEASNGRPAPTQRLRSSLPPRPKAGPAVAEGCVVVGGRPAD